MINSKRIRFAIGGLLLAGVGWYLWAHAELFDALLKFDPWFLLPLLAVHFISTLINGWILKLQMARFRISLTPVESFGLAIMHAMANYLPFPQAGAVTKGVYLKKKYELAYTPFAASVLYSFALSLAATGLIGIAALLASRLQVPWMLWLVLLAMPLSALALIPSIWKLPVLRSMDRFSSGLELLWDSRLNCLVFLQNCGITLLLAWGLFLSFQSVGQPVTWLAALILAVGPILAGIVKLTPGNLGLAESLAWMTAVMIGVKAEQTIVALAVFRITALIFCFTLGPFFVRHVWKTLSPKTIPFEEPRLRNAA